MSEKLMESFITYSLYITTCALNGIVILPMVQLWLCNHQSNCFLKCVQGLFLAINNGWSFIIYLYTITKMSRKMPPKWACI